MKVRPIAIEKSVAGACKARDKLTQVIGQHHAKKVCCICDQLLGNGDEIALNIDRLKDDGIKDILRHDVFPFDDYNISNETKSNLIKTYSQHAYDTRKAKYEFLKHLTLSSNSYAIKQGQQECLGCC